MIDLWQKLDSMVPKGSHLVVSGIYEGEILYDCLHDKEVFNFIF